MILGIETSCDETAAAVVEDDGSVRASVVASQDELHAPYGGVVPEIASRRHLELVGPVVREALDRSGVALDAIERVGVTRGPGLVGALLVGLSAAKAIAWARELPLVPVDHLQGPRRVALSRCRSHSSRRFRACSRAAGTRSCSRCESEARSERLGGTLDDAAGEAFDKGARLLGLGYPGGSAIDRIAREGDSTAFDFPVARTSRSRLLLFRREDRFALRRSRPRRRRRSTRGGPISPRRTSTRSCGRSCDGCRAPPQRPASSGSPSSEESPRTRSCGQRSPTRRSRHCRCARTTRR